MRTKMMIAALSAVCVLSSQAVVATAASASVLHSSASGMHLFMGSKTVSFSVNNSSSDPLMLTIGDQTMTIQPGKTVAVKAAVGAKIVSTNETKNYKAGEVVKEISKDMSDVTLHIG